MPWERSEGGGREMVTATPSLPEPVRLMPGRSDSLSSHGLWFTVIA